VPAVALTRLRKGNEEEAAETGADRVFDEMYRGRRIRGAVAGSGGTGPGARWHVTVDGRPLPLMRRADGTYLSMVDHYRSYPTALAATRAAVDELGTAQRLRAVPAAGHGHTGGAPGHSGGSGHGVHA
jgi:hypothetical protein